MHSKTERAIIFLLEGEKSKSDLAELVFRGRTDYNITRLNEEILKPNKGLFNIKIYSLGDHRKKFVHLNLDDMFNKIEKGIAKQIKRNCGRINLKEFKNLKEFINRDKRIMNLIFNLDYVKPIFYRNGHWILPSLKGFINICLFYSFYFFIKFKGVMKEDINFIKNTRIMVVLSVMNLHNKELSLEKIEQKEKKLLENLMKKCEEIGLDKDIDTKDLNTIESYFELISTYYFPSYKKHGRFEYVSLLTQGISINLNTESVKRMIKQETKSIPSMDEFSRKLIKAMKKKESFSNLVINDIEKEPDYFDYMIDLSKIQHYIEPIKMTMELFT